MVQAVKLVEGCPEIGTQSTVELMENDAGPANLGSRRKSHSGAAPASAGVAPVVAVTPLQIRLQRCPMQMMLLRPPQQRFLQSTTVAAMEIALSVAQVPFPLLLKPWTVKLSAAKVQAPANEQRAQICTMGPQHLLRSICFELLVP